MKKTALAVLGILCLFQTANSQTLEEKNLQTYWNYRNKQAHDFIKVGKNHGESIPVQYIFDNTKASGPEVTPGTYGYKKWGDAMANLDAYFGTLATEYYLLKREGKDVTATLNEIYYALEMINRLDRFAEDYFSGGTTPITLNGFCTRDDAMLTTVSEWNNEYILTENPNDRIDGIYSDTYSPSDPASIRPQNEPSQDQYIGAYMGLAHLIKFVDNVYVKPTSSDVGFYIHNEARAIAQRLLSYIMTYKHEKFKGGGCQHNYYSNWILSNPITNDKVLRGWDVRLFSYGLRESYKKMNGSLLGLPPIESNLLRRSKIKVAGAFCGSSTRLVSINSTIAPFWYGLPGVMNSVLTPGVDEVYINVPNLTYCTPYLLLFADEVPPSGDLCIDFGPINFPDYNANLSLELATVSGTWTHSQVVNVADKYGMHIFDLVYAGLHDQTPMKSKAFYENFLATAPCQGPYNYDNADPTKYDPIWNETYKWSHPLGPSGNAHGEYPGLDYTWLYNMYRIAFEDEISLPYTDNSCPCVPNPRIENNTSSGVLNSDLTIYRKFEADYNDKSIFVKEHSINDFEIPSGRKLTILTDLIVCNNSTFNINGGEAIIGDVTGKKCSIVVRSGSKLKIQGGGKLNANENCTVLIEKGAFLEIYSDPQINLIGNNSVLEINGLTILNDGTTFKFGGNGFLRWDTPYAPGPGLIAGENCRVLLNGSGPGDLVLEMPAKIGEDFWLPSNLVTFELTNGYALLKNAARIAPTCPYRIKNAFIESQATDPTTVRGLQVFGTLNSSIENSTFKNTKVRYDYFGGKPMTIYNTTLDNTPVIANGGGYRSTKNTFINHGYENRFYQVLPSFILQGQMAGSYNAYTGVAMGNYQNNSVIDIKKSTFSGSPYSEIEVSGPGFCNLKCNTIMSQFAGVSVYESNLNASTISNLGGYNTIQGPNGGYAIDFRDAQQINLDMGYNDLRPASGGQIIDGSYVIPCPGSSGTFGATVPANFNRWLSSNAIDPNATGDVYVYTTASLSVPPYDGCFVNFTDANRGAIATCGEFDVSGPVISSTSPFGSHAEYPLITSPIFGTKPLNEAVFAVSKNMEFIDSSKNDFSAIIGFRDILTNPSLDISNPNIMFLVKYAYGLAKTSFQNCFVTGRLTKDMNNPAWHPCGNHYQQIISALKQPVNQDNFKWQFELSMDEALAFYWVGRYDESLNLIGNIDNCYLGEVEYQTKKYWSDRITNEKNFNTGAIGMQEFLEKNSSLEKTIITERPSIKKKGTGSTISPLAMVGPGTVIGTNCTIEENVTIGQNVVIGNNVIIRKNTVIKDKVTVGNNSTIDKDGFIGEGTYIGANASFDKNLIIGGNNAIADNVVLKKSIKTGDYVSICKLTNLDENIEIASGTYIGENVKLAKDTKIGTNAIIRNSVIADKGLKLGDNAIIEANVHLDQGIRIGTNGVIKTDLTIGKNAIVCDNMTVTVNMAANAKAGTCTSPTTPSSYNTNVNQCAFAMDFAAHRENFLNGFELITDQPNNLIIAGKAFSLKSTSINKNIDWNIGSCITASGQDPLMVINEAGTYLVKITVGNDCLSKELFGAITVYPDFNIGYNTSLPTCVNNDSATFNADLSTSALNISCTDGDVCSKQQNLYLANYKINLHWKFKSLNTSRDYDVYQMLANTDENEAVSAVNYIDSDVTLEADLYTLSPLSGQPVYLGHKNYNQFISAPNYYEPQIFSSGEVCENDTLIFLTEEKENTSYNWDFGNGQTGTGLQPSTGYYATGSYTVKLNATDTMSGCMYTAQKIITVLDCLGDTTSHDSLRMDNFKPGSATAGPENIIKVYPNPSQGHLTVEIVSQSENLASIRIFNAVGQTIYSQAGINSKMVTLDLEQPDGMYYLEILSGGNRTLKKIIIQPKN